MIIRMRIEAVIQTEAKVDMHDLAKAIVKEYFDTDVSYEVVVADEAVTYDVDSAKVAHVMED